MPLPLCKYLTLSFLPTKTDNQAVWMCFFVLFLSVFVDRKEIESEY